MREWGRKPGKKMWGKDSQRDTRFLILPVAAVILALLIILADRPSKESGQDHSPAAEQGVPGESVADRSMPGESVADPGVTDESLADSVRMAAAVADLELKQDEIPELSALVQAYCHAKEDCDPAALAQVFGREAGSEEEQEEERVQMERVSRMVEGYENIICYFMDGPVADTYVLYPYFEIRYQDALVTMPVLTWAYAVKGEDGQFYMTQDIDESVEAYVAETGRMEAVRTLVAQVKEKAEEAAAGDEVLKQIYGKTGISGDGSSVEIVEPQ